MNKKKVFVVALAVCLVAILSLSSLAWFNASDSVTNEFKVADSDDPDTLPDFSVDVFETDEDGEKLPGGKEYENVLPGAKLAKDPTVENTGNYDMYTRVIVTLSDAKTWIDASAKYDLAADDNYVLESMIDLNTTDWYRYDAPVYDAAADTLTYVYYYNGVVEAGKTTSALFTAVTIPTALQAEDMDYGTDGTFTIDVKADAIQSENIIPEGTALTKIAAWHAFDNAGWAAGSAYGS